MGRFIDLTGQKFGRLAAIKRADKHTSHAVWLCVCECGNEVLVRSCHLRSGHTQSCGCLQKERTSEASIKHGHNTKNKRTPEYNIWAMMIQRCENPKNKNYPDYGGRGVTVCERWKTFENFLADMGERPSPNHSLERVDNNKGYSPENCIWADKTIQARNQRTSKRNTTGVRGVQWDKDKQKYRATITVNGKKKYLGLFETLEEATEIRKKAEEIYWKKSS